MANDTQILNLDNPKTRAMLCGWVQSIRGIHRVSIRKAHRGRTLSQNAYLWGVVYPAVRAGLNEAWGEDMNVDEVHEWMKARFLARPVVNRQTGECMGERPGSSAGLDVSEFCRYVDQVINFAAEWLNVTVPPSDEYAPASR